MELGVSFDRPLDQGALVGLANSSGSRNKLIKIENRTADTLITRVPLYPLDYALTFEKKRGV